MDEEKVLDEEVKQEEHVEKKQRKVNLKEYQELQSQFEKALALNLRPSFAKIAEQFLLEQQK